MVTCAGLRGPAHLGSATRGLKAAAAATRKPTIVTNGARRCSVRGRRSLSALDEHEGGQHGIPSGVITHEHTRSPIEQTTATALTPKCCIAARPTSRPRSTKGQPGAVECSPPPHLRHLRSPRGSAP
eukprot:scaffold6607_cov60-Phaeocystis_antarctica.AAC.3